jgi:hypothetical protein
MLLESPPKPIGEKRITFRKLDWVEFKQIQQLLTERTHARFIIATIERAADGIVNRATNCTESCNNNPIETG